MMLKIQLRITEINYSLKHIQIEKDILNCNNILQYCCFYCIFGCLGEQFFFLNLTDPNILNINVLYNYWKAKIVIMCFDVLLMKL